MTGQSYQGLNGKRYTAGRRIGGGGEGVVFDVQENTSLVIKIYSDAVEKDKGEKIIYMSSLADDELTKFAAWPRDAVRDKSQNICGFVMQKLESFVPLHNLFSPMDRKKLFPDKGYNFLAHVSRNLAAAFHKIHQLGIVVGDVNEANILVNSAGMVSLIDCDSFQIKHGSYYHFCEVGIPRYTPPELLLRGSFDKVVRTINTDNFSLATLIFQLLFLGRAPFTGKNPGHQEIDEETAIKTYEFAYSLKRQNKKLFPAKHALNLSIMPSGISALFHAAFESSMDRPSASMWVNELSNLSKVVVQCTKTKIHHYPEGAGYCPWCQFRDQDNILYFLDDSYLKNIPELKDIDQFVNGFKIDKIDHKILTEAYRKPVLAAKSIDPKFRYWKIFNLAVIGAIALVTIVLCFYINWLCIAGGWIALLVFGKLSPTSSKLAAELASRKNTLDTLKISLANLVKQHNAPSEFSRYNESARKLRASIESFRKLPVEFEQSKKKIQETHYAKKLNIYRQQFDIRDFPIPSFGSAKKLLIYTNGIRTAADISKLHQIKVAGIGPKNIQVLLDWQRHISSGFTYKPDVNVINQEINAVATAISNRRKLLEMEIRSEYKAVSLLKTNILALTGNLEQQYDNLVIKVHQAQLDFDAFKKFR